MMEQHRNSVTRNGIYHILRRCERQKDLISSRRVYALMLRSGFDTIAALIDHIIRILAYHGALLEANSAFNKIAETSLYTWAAIISANARLGQGETSLDLYHSLGTSGVKCDNYVYISVLKACSVTRDLSFGRIIHHQIIQNELQLYVMLGNTLIDMYAKCGSLEEACNIFDKLSTLDVVSWNALISGFTHHGEGLTALHMFEIMESEGIRPDKITFLNVLKACASVGAIDQGRRIHEQVTKSDFQCDVIVGSSLVNMYAKCGSMREAQDVLSALPNADLVSWNAVICGYAENGEGDMSLECLEKMHQEALRPNEVTFLGALKACVSIRGVGQGKRIHSIILRTGLHSELLIGSALVDMYAKCACLEEAYDLFCRLQNRNVVCWNAMITGYAQHQEGHLAFEFLLGMQHDGIKPNVVSWAAVIAGYAELEECLVALQCLEMMVEAGIEPNEVTFLNILKACAILGAIEQGKTLHNRIINCGMQSNLVMYNTIIDMYAKCGSMEIACDIFSKMCDRDIVTWNIMISGYSYQGEGHVAQASFKKMQQEGLMPNESTFTSILIACSHAGLVDEGYWHFCFVSGYKHVLLAPRHYTCLVDLMCRAGCLDEAEDLLQASVQANVLAWTSLLNACRTFRNVELGSHCFDQILVLDFTCDVGYILMSNIYADAAANISEIESLKETCVSTGETPSRWWKLVRFKV